MSRCGACTLCCTVLSVGEIEKPGFKRCDYQRDPPATKIGCAIYETRPMSCRKWDCMYIANIDWEEDLRPDRTGVVFDTIPDIVLVNGKERAAVQAWVRPGTDINTLSQQPLLAVVLAITTGGMPVLFRLNENLAMGVAFEDGELRWTEPTAPTLGELESSRMRRVSALVPRTFHEK